MSRYESLAEDCALSIGADADKLSALGNSRILITGGTGFVGSWIAEMIAFLNDRYRLGVHLTLFSPHASEFSERAPHLAERADISLLEGDVRNLSSVPVETDWILHAAGSPDSRIHLSNPIRTMETIVLGTHNVLQAASRIGSLKRVLVLSSGLVCGPQQWESAPLIESSYSGLDCNSLVNLYAESKRAAEMITTGYRSQSGIPVVTARPFTFVGPYQLLDRPWRSTTSSPRRCVGDRFVCRATGPRCGVICTAAIWHTGCCACWWMVGLARSITWAVRKAFR